MLAGLRVADGFTSYLNAIGRIPLLSPSEEVTLGTAVRRWLDHPEPVPRSVERAGRRARDRMTKANLRLAVRFAARFKHLRDLEFDDLVQAANLGLLRAVEKFDPARGYRFSTYAYWWIRKSTTRYIERHGVMVSMPGTDAERLARLAPVTNRLRLELGREPVLAEVAQVLDIQPDRLAELVNCNSRCWSLDAPAPSAGDGSEDRPPIAAALEAPPVETDERLEIAAEVLPTLPPLHRRLVAAAAGLDGPPQSAAAIARAEQMDASQVRALLRAAGQMAQDRSRRRRRPAVSKPPAAPASPQPQQQQRPPIRSGAPSVAGMARPSIGPARPAASPPVRRLR